MNTHSPAPSAKRYLYLALFSACISGSANAACTTVGTTTNCDSSSTQTARSSLLVGAKAPSTSINVASGGTLGSQGQSYGTANNSGTVAVASLYANANKSLDLSGGKHSANSMNIGVP